MNNTGIDHTYSSFKAYQADTSQSSDLEHLHQLALGYKRSLQISNDYSYYLRFLDTLKNNQRCEVRLFTDRAASLSEEKFALYLRHDMDVEPFSSPALSKALFNAGLAGSFYVLHTAEYYGHRMDDTFIRYSYIADLLRQIQNEYGCEVGLHNDCLWVYQQWGMEGSHAIRTELQWLREQGLNIVGTAAHNSGPVYGAENFEIFKGRAALNRLVLEKNGQKIPLQSLNEVDLGLQYEANYAEVKNTTYNSELKEYLAGFPPDAIRNQQWMRRYLLDNPLCRWGSDYNLWLVGVDTWIISGHINRDPLFMWNVNFDEICRFLNNMTAGKHIVCHVHPFYIDCPSHE